MSNYTTALPGAFTVERAKASEFENMRQALDALTGTPTDISSTFTIGASVTPPTKGSSTYLVEYNRVLGWVDFSFFITINTGGGFAAGSGAWRFPLPVTARDQGWSGTAHVFDTGTDYRIGALSLIDSTTYALIVLTNLAGSPLGSAGPGTAWNTGDKVWGTIRYPAA